MRRWQWCLAAAVSLLIPAATAYAQQYDFRVLATGLARPTGIAVRGNNLYFTELPNPGVGNMGNAVKRLHLLSEVIETLHMGEPEPVNIAVGSDGSIYWICKSAGVILKQDRHGNTSVFSMGRHKPSGIDISNQGVVYFTEVPNPGMPGMMNGVFSTADGATIGTINMGEPEPVDVAVAPNGDVYWTCKSAGVILVRRAHDGSISALRTGLNKPSGIAVDRGGRNLYFTEVPTPGVGGGANRVLKIDLHSGEMTVIHSGDPEPTDVAVGEDGTVYWTCTSAGVIVEARLRRGPGGS